MKCVLIANKEKRIKQLTAQNEQLQKQLISFTEAHQIQISNSKSLENQIANLSAQLEAQILKSQDLDNLIDAQANQINSHKQRHTQIEKQLNNILETNKKINAQLFKQQQQAQQLELLIDRMNKQLKTTLNFQKSGSNSILKIYEQKKKKLDASVKTIQILNNKFQSLYKFLNILRNKKQKQQEKAQSALATQVPKNPHSYKYLPKQNSKLTPNTDSIEGTRYLADKKKMKKLDEEIRKKNLILMGRRK